MKKALLVLATILATNTYAFSATEVLNTFIAPGTYDGTYAGEKCQIVVQEVNFPNTAQNITISNSKFTVSKLVANDAEFYYDEDTRNFVTKERAVISNEGYVIKSISISQEQENIFSFEVKDMYFINRNFWVNAVSCYIVK